jgi:Putative DNA-binding domain
MEVLRASMKTTCAFLNGQGGTLLIGVADTGEPKGLEDDLQDFSDKKSVDGFELKFRDALSKNVNPDPNQLVRLSFPYASGIQSCRVDVNRCPRPVFLVAKGGPADSLSVGAMPHPPGDRRQTGLRVCSRSLEVTNVRGTERIYQRRRQA